MSKEQNELIEFVKWLNTDRLFFVDEVRNWLKQFYNNEISFSKFVELFNEKVYHKYSPSTREGAKSKND